MPRSPRANWPSPPNPHDVVLLEPSFRERTSIVLRAGTTVATPAARRTTWQNSGGASTWPCRAVSRPRGARGHGTLPAMNLAARPENTVQPCRSRARSPVAGAGAACTRMAQVLAAPRRSSFTPSTSWIEPFASRPMRHALSSSARCARLSPAVRRFDLRAAAEKEEAAARMAWGERLLSRPLPESVLHTSRATRKPHATGNGDFVATRPVRSMQQ